MIDKPWHSHYPAIPLARLQVSCGAANGRRLPDRQAGVFRRCYICMARPLQNLARDGVGMRLCLGRKHQLLDPFVKGTSVVMKRTCSSLSKHRQMWC